MDLAHQPTRGDIYFPTFPKAYKVIAIDLTGFGLSDKPLDNNYSISDQRGIVYEFQKVHNYMLSTHLISSHFRANKVLMEAFFDHTKITEDIVATYVAYLSLPGINHSLIHTAQQIVQPNIDDISELYKSIAIPVLII